MTEAVMSDCALVPVPSVPEDIDINWVSSTLNLRVVPESFHVIPNIHQGMGFLSNMLRLQFDHIDESNTSTHKRQSMQVVVKLLPTDAFARSVVIPEEMDKIELNFYRYLLPELISVAPDLKQYFCNCLHGRINNTIEPYASVLVLEDLSVQNYITKAFDQSFDELEMKSGIEFQAKLHWSAKTLELHLQRPILDVFDCFAPWYDPNHKSSMLRSMFPLGFKFTYDTLSQFENSSTSSVKEDYAALEPHSDKIFEKVLAAGQINATLIHGDLWSHNVMVAKQRNDNCMSNLPVKVIDWQLNGYTDPAFDLAIFLLSNLSIEELTMSKLEQYALSYYNKFTALIGNSRSLDTCPSLFSRSWEDFLSFFKSYGLAYCFIWFVMGSEGIISRAANVPKIYNVFKFLHDDAKIHEFMMSIL